MTATIDGREFRRILSMTKAFHSKHGRLSLYITTNGGCTGKNSYGIAYLTTDSGYTNLFFNATLQAGVVRQSIAVERLAYINYPGVEEAEVGNGKISIYCQGGEVYTHTMKEEQ
jgi:hypothetical protein